MVHRDIIVIGAMRRGVEALCELVRGLPPALPAALFVVCHFPSGGRSWLPDILGREMPCRPPTPATASRSTPGASSVAPPDHHLVLERDEVRLSRALRENRFRPAIDPLFLRRARVFGPRVMGVLLSGVLSDGVAGLRAVRIAGRRWRCCRTPTTPCWPSCRNRRTISSGRTTSCPSGEMAGCW